MNRRDVLKLGALAGVGGSGCASLLSNPASVSGGELSSFLSALDAAMAAVMAGQPFERFFETANNPTLAARARASEDLARKTLRSMLLVGTLAELPPDQVALEGVQQRLRGSMEEFDDAVFGMTQMLEQLSPSDRATVSKALQDDPGLGMRIMGSFDQEAAALGISKGARAKLRAVSTQACARLRQSSEFVIAEYTGKVRKIEARHGARAEAQRKAAAALGGALLWQQAEGGIDSSSFKPVVGGDVPVSVDAGSPEVAPVDEGLGRPGGPSPVSPSRPTTCITSSDCGEQQVCQDYQRLGEGKWSHGVCRPAPPKEKYSPGILTVGGIVMGVAAVSIGVVGFAAGGIVYGLTAGALIGALGLIILIVGLIVLATGH
jgi:hypothetical protein